MTLFFASAMGEAALTTGRCLLRQVGFQLKKLPSPQTVSALDNSIRFNVLSGY